MSIFCSKFNVKKLHIEPVWNSQITRFVVYMLSFTLMFSWITLHIFIDIFLTELSAAQLVSSVHGIKIKMCSRTAASFSPCLCLLLWTHECRKQQQPVQHRQTERTSDQRTEGSWQRNQQLPCSGGGGLQQRWGEHEELCEGEKKQNQLNLTPA